MTQKCVVTFGNVSQKVEEQRFFESKNQAFIWINHKMTRAAANCHNHELFFRLESYGEHYLDSEALPF